jgi:hypothetical protein
MLGSGPAGKACFPSQHRSFGFDALFHNRARLGSRETGVDSASRTRRARKFPEVVGQTLAELRLADEHRLPTVVYAD